VRRLVTGVDAHGRSCVVEEVEFEPPAEAPAMRTIFETSASPPPARPPGHGEDLDLEVAPGTVRWIHVEFQPGTEAPMHHTDTVDFDTIITGQVDLILDDGPHRLGPGDCVVVTGVDHGWKAGPEGCTSSVVLVGTPPRP
jgi:quercetin dioxygenase-like cupin family protein